MFTRIAGVCSILLLSACSTISDTVEKAADGVQEREDRSQRQVTVSTDRRSPIPDDPYYALTNDLPMGALSTSQLAQVIALEIEHQIIEKSMRGHVAADEQSAP